MHGFNLNAARVALNRDAGPVPTLLALALFVAMAAVLCGCAEDEPMPTKRYNETTTNIASSITDYGMIDGCSVKYIETTSHPDFWMVKCKGATVSTEYETGGKAKKRIGAATSIE